MKLIACETTAAFVMHIRVLDGEPNYSGHSPHKPTLCGMLAAWDVRSPVTEAHCRACLAIAPKVVL